MLDQPSEATAPHPLSRARWFLLLPPIRLLLAACLLLLFILAFATVLKAIPGHDLVSRWLFGDAPYARDLTGSLFSELALAVSVLFTGGLLARWIERRPLAELCPTPGRALRDLFAGFLCGGLIMSVVVGLLAVTGWFRFAGQPDALWPIVVTALIYLLVGVSEEMLFRGILFRILEEGLGTWVALVLASLLFGLAHLANANASLSASLSITLEAGILLAAAYILTRNLWLAIGIHWGWNFFQGSVFGAHVSGNGDDPALLHGEPVGPHLWTGGAFGPEAGLVALFVALTAGLILLAAAWCRGQFRVPQWWMERRLRRTAAPEEAPLSP